MTIARHRGWLKPIALICAWMLVPGDIRLIAQQPAPGAETPAAKPAKTPDQLDSLVAPIALYPDPILAQSLAASTYPLEIVQCARWLKANPKLTGENLTKAAAKQPWDPSVQALVGFPAVLQLLDKNIQWTQDLGNAFLEQQSDVMDAIQRMRKKAKDGGKLTSGKEQKVEVKTIESKTIIEIQPSDPQVIYVPSYDPVVVYGAAPVYAYPPVAYPAGAYVATAAVSFGVGVMMGAMWGGCCGGGGWGWNAGWSNNNININNNFNNRYGYNNSSRVNTGNVGSGNRGGGNSWQHNPEHRRSVPYASNNAAQKFGGSSRDAAGRTQRSDNRGAGSGSRDASGARSAGSANRDAGARNSGGGDRMGNRSVSSGGSGRDSSAFGGSQSRASTQASSNRGFSSSRSSAGGGGGARSSGGASRGGGGRRR